MSEKVQNIPTSTGQAQLLAGAQDTQSPAQAVVPVPAPPAAAAAPAGDAAPEERRRPPAALVGGAILLTLIFNLGWNVATDLNAPSSSTGSVAAYTAQIAPRVSGQVVELFVKDNQTVTAGEPLFQLDPAPFDLAVRQAEASLQQAMVGLAAGTASLIAAEAQVDQARASLVNVEARTLRTRSLRERGLSTQADADAAEAALAQSQASLDAAEAQLESARLQAGGDTHTTPQTDAAQAQLEQAQLNRQFALVTAPADGVITNLRLAHGQFMGAGTSALTFIEAEDPWITVDMRENQLANIDVGDAARVLFDAVPGQTFDARVRGIAWGIDPGRSNANGLPVNQQSTRWFEPARTIPVQLELVDAGEWPANVRAGSKVTALVYANGSSGIVARVESVFQTVKSYLSYLY